MGREGQSNRTFVEYILWPGGTKKGMDVNHGEIRLNGVCITKEEFDGKGIYTLYTQDPGSL